MLPEPTLCGRTAEEEKLQILDLEEFEETRFHAAKKNLVRLHVWEILQNN